MIDIESKKDQWAMLTDGKNEFSRIKLLKGSRMSISRPGFFFIFADTQEELLSQVFKNPSAVNPSVFGGQDIDRIKQRLAAMSGDPQENQDSTDHNQENGGESNTAEPNENLELMKTKEYCENYCKVFEFDVNVV